MKATQLLAVVIVLQVVTLLGQWFGSASYVTPAQAQVVDAGAQRIQIIEQLKESNAKLDKLISVLENGTIQVKVAPRDQK